MPTVLVIGAGPTGLLFTIWLKTIAPKVSVRIVADTSGPGTTSRAVAVQARTLEYYEQLGFVDRALAAGHLLVGPEVMMNGRTRGGLSLVKAGKGLSRYNYALALTQERHEEILVGRLRELGVEIEWGRRMVSRVVREDGSMVVGMETVGGQDGGAVEEVETEFLIGCDGHGSFVRKSMGSRMTGETYRQMFFVADFSVEASRALDKIYVNPNAEQFYLLLCLDDWQWLLPMDLPFVQRRAFDVISQIGIKYANQSLQSLPGSKGVQAGDRLPWIQIGDSDNFESLKLNGFQIHVYGDGLDVKELHGLPVRHYSQSKETQAAGLLPDVIYMTRPDGYVTMTARIDDTSAVQRYIMEWSIC